MLATLEWVAFGISRKLHSACGYVPPENRGNLLRVPGESGRVNHVGKKVPLKLPGRPTNPDYSTGLPGGEPAHAGATQASRMGRDDLAMVFAQISISPIVWRMRGEVQQSATYPQVRPYMHAVCKPAPSAI